MIRAPALAVCVADYELRFLEKIFEKRADGKREILLHNMGLKPWTVYVWFLDSFDEANAWKRKARAAVAASGWLFCDRPEQFDSVKRKCYIDIQFNADMCERGEFCHRCRRMTR